MRDKAALAAEVDRLRSLVGHGRSGSATVRRAAADALFLVQQRFLGHGTGRVEAERHGMSKRRWAWAVAYLRYAGVVSTRTGNWRHGLKWVATEAEAVKLLADAKGVTCTQLRVLRREV